MKPKGSVHPFWICHHSIPHKLVKRLDDFVLKSPHQVSSCPHRLIVDMGGPHGEDEVVDKDTERNALRAEPCGASDAASFKSLEFTLM